MVRDININSCLKPLTKFTSSRKSIEFKDILPWNTRIDHPNKHKNSHKQCDETGHRVVNMMESQWKLRQQHDQNFLNGGKAIIEQILVSEERNPREQHCENHSLGSEWESYPSE